MMRKHTGQEQSLSLAGPQVCCGRRALLDVVLIGATETPIERPKNKGAAARARRSGTH